MKNSEWIASQGWKFSNLSADIAKGNEEWNIYYFVGYVDYTFNDVSEHIREKIGAIKKTKEPESCYKGLLRWLDKEHIEKPKLTPKEKAYLKLLIEPFKDSIKEVQKTIYKNHLWLQITFRPESTSQYTDCFGVPLLYSDFALSDLDFSKKYTLDELGLDE